jgi:hypothetical protein
VNARLAQQHGVEDEGRKRHPESLLRQACAQRDARGDEHGMGGLGELCDALVSLPRERESVPEQQHEAFARVPEVRMAHERQVLLDSADGDVLEPCGANDGLEIGACEHHGLVPALMQGDADADERVDVA